MHDHNIIAITIVKLNFNYFDIFIDWWIAKFDLIIIYHFNSQTEAPRSCVPDTDRVSLFDYDHPLCHFI